MIDDARGRPPARQLALPLAHQGSFRRADLVESSANRHAIALIDHWPDWPGVIAAIIGPPRSGKSHMADIWARRAAALVLNPEKIGPPPVNLKAAVIDGLDRPAKLDETGLFHLINALRQSSGHLLVTASRPLGALDVRLPDLASRLATATVAEISMPDDDLLRALIAKGFADRQLAVDADVAAYLAPRIERSASAAAAMVERLDGEAMARGAKITKAFAAMVLKVQGAADEPELF
jgi:chromosomal replication initiation ATPase DnaA